MPGFILNCSSTDAINFAVNLLPQDLMITAFYQCLCFGIMCLVWKCLKKCCPKYREQKRKDKEIYHQIMKESKRKEKHNQDLLETNRKLTSDAHGFRSQRKELRNTIADLERTIVRNDRQLLDACTRLTASQNETKNLHSRNNALTSTLNQLQYELTFERNEREKIEGKYFKM